MAKVKRPDVAAIIINWNGWRYTVEACRSIQHSCGKDVDIFVVDNASTDDSIERIKAAVPRVQLIKNPINGGFSGGCNLGMRIAQEMNYEHVFLLNNDAVVTVSTIPELLIASEKLNHSAILGSVIRYAASGKYQFFGSRTTRLSQPRWFEWPRDKALLEQPTIESDFIMGAALLIPSKVLAMTGYFDERFFLTYEDADLCYRARKLGVSCAVVTSSVVYHHASVSMGPETGPLQSYFLTRNELLFTAKNAEMWQRGVLFYMRSRRLIWRALKSLALAKAADLPIKAIFAGFRDYLFGRFGDCPRAIREYAAAHEYRPADSARPHMVPDDL